MYDTCWLGRILFASCERFVHKNLIMQKYSQSAVLHDACIFFRLSARSAIR